MHDNAQPHLSRVLTRTPQNDTAEDDSGLPTLSQDEYVPHSRPSNKPVFAIHFVGTGGEVRTFQYVHLDSDSSLAPDRIALRFIGLKPIKVLIHGRNLRKVYELIHEHRMQWLLAANRDFASDGETIVSAIMFEEVNPDS